MAFFPGCIDVGLCEGLFLLEHCNIERENWNLILISAKLTGTKTLRDTFNFKGCSGNFQCNLCHNKIARQGARRIASCNKAFNF